MVGNILGWLLGWALRLTIGTVYEILNPYAEDKKGCTGWFVILMVVVFGWLLKVNLL